jgi:hypothetical protein
MFSTSNKRMWISSGLFYPEEYNERVSENLLIKAVSKLTARRPPPCTKRCQIHERPYDLNSSLPLKNLKHTYSHAEIVMLKYYSKLFYEKTN